MTRGRPKKINEEVTSAPMVIEHPDTAQDAFLLFQQNVPAIIRDTQGAGYKYATLDSMISAVRPLLNELGFILRFENSVEGVNAIIEFKDGTKYSTNSMPFPSPYPTDPQVAGAWHTYLRRYTLSALLGVASEDDTDGKAQIAYVEAKSPSKDPTMAQKTSMATLEKAIMEASPERLSSQLKKLIEDQTAFVSGKKTAFSLTGDEYESLIDLINTRLTGESQIV
jgi:hypothetical protein